MRSEQLYCLKYYGLQPRSKISWSLPRLSKYALSSLMPGPSFYQSWWLSAKMSHSCSSRIDGTQWMRSWERSCRQGSIMRANQKSEWWPVEFWMHASEQNLDRQDDPKGQGFALGVFLYKLFSVSLASQSLATAPYFVPSSVQFEVSANERHSRKQCAQRTFTAPSFTCTPKISLSTKTLSPLSTCFPANILVCCALLKQTTH